MLASTSPTHAMRSTGIVRAALLALLTLCSATGAALAQGFVINKTPTGPDVITMMNGFSIPAGSDITWEINFVPPVPFQATFIDMPQDRECERGGTGMREETAPQTSLYFVDNNGDGNCNEQVLMPDPTWTVQCDPMAQRLEIQGIDAGFGERVTIRYKTHVDEMTPIGTNNICNWGHFVDPVTGNPLRNTNDPNIAMPSCTCLSTVAPNPTSVSVTKTVDLDNPGQPLIPNDPNSTVVYTITTINDGTTDINTGSLTDTLPAGLEWVPPAVTCDPPLTCTFNGTNTRLTVSGYRLMMGTSQAVQARARVTCAAATDDDTGVLCNQATFTSGPLSASSDDPNLPGDQDPTCVNVIFSNLTQSEKIFDHFDDANGNGTLDAGERVHFTIRAINEGRLTAQQVIIRDDIATVGCFDVATVMVEDGGVDGGGTLTWRLGDIFANGGVVEVHFSVVLAADAECCNQAGIQSQERLDCSLVREILTNDPDPSSPPPPDPTCIRPGPQPNLVVHKSWCQEPMPPTGCDRTMLPITGDHIRWTVTIENTGAAAATLAQFLDDFNTWPCNGSFDGMVTCTTTDGTDCGMNASTPAMPGIPPTFGQVLMTRLGGANGIQPGEIITLEFVVQVQGSPTTCCNEGEVSYAQRSTPVVTDDPNTPLPDNSCLLANVQQFEGQLGKTVRPIDVNTDGRFATGDEVEYTLTFSNIGTSPLTNVAITDASSACIEFIPASVTIEPPGSGVDTSTTAGLQITLPGPVASGATVTITARATVLAGGDCCNQAQWRAAEAAGPFVSDRDPTDFVPDQPTCHTAETVTMNSFELSVTKTSDAAGCVDPGTLVNFTVQVRNVGTSTVANWSLSDPLPAGFTGIAVTPPLTLSGSTVTLMPGPSIDSGDVQTYRYSARVPCTTGGMLTNTATATYETDPGMMATDASSTDVTWGAPNLGTSRKNMTFDDRDGSGHVDVGEIVTYTLTITNTGTCAARDVVVTDDLAAEFDEGSITFDPGDNGMIGGDIITWNSGGVPELASIPAAGSVTLVFHLVVDPTTPEGRLISNSFHVDATGNSTAGCPPAPPPPPTAWDVIVSPAERVPWGMVVITRRADLLRNAAYPGESIASIMSAAAPNDDTCGSSSLDQVNDIYAMDVEAALNGAGVVVAGDGMHSNPTGGPGYRRVVFYEVSEWCLPAEGGTDNPICVSKAAANVVIHATATPGNCP